MSNLLVALYTGRFKEMRNPGVALIRDQIGVCVCGRLPTCAGMTTYGEARWLAETL